MKTEIGMLLNREDAPILSRRL